MNSTGNAYDSSKDERILRIVSLLFTVVVFCILVVGFDRIIKWKYGKYLTTPAPTAIIHVLNALTEDALSTDDRMMQVVSVFENEFSFDAEVETNEITASLMKEFCNDDGEWVPASYRFTTRRTNYLEVELYDVSHTLLDNQYVIVYTLNEDGEVNTFTFGTLSMFAHSGG